MTPPPPEYARVETELRGLKGEVQGLRRDLRDLVRLQTLALIVLAGVQVGKSFLNV